MRKFVVLTTQRSGSVALIQSLSSHPDIVCFGEIFLKGATYARNMSVPPGRSNFLYEEYIRESLSNRVRALLAPKASERDFLETFYGRHEDKAAAGFKLMYSQIANHRGTLDWILRHDVGIIHLVREDALRVILSRHTRVKTGVAHSAAKIDAASLRLDPVGLVRQLDAREKNVKRFRELLTDKPGSMEIRYEHYLENRPSENRRILQFLGVSPDIELTSGVVKQATRPLREIIENYDEVLTAVRGTPHMRFFEE
ncbi:hypothetical protein THIOKS11100017 [Thiocapsa sp. KS1]|nr:sulfotransferase [Thiocapsa sp. KS1]CRI63004.1 hypothetical protein THIOKS11100017 [Thiocapsa sp. KS1]